MPIGTAIAIGSAIYGGGKALKLWGKPPKRRYKQSAEEKAYFDLLQKRSTEGAYSKGALFRRQRQVTASASEQMRKLEISREGRALARGTQGVSSREAQKVADVQLIDILAKSASEGEDIQELSKIQAQDELGRLGLEKSRRESQIAHENAMAQYGAQQAGVSQFLSGLTQAGQFYDASQISTIGDIVSKDSSTWTPSETATMQELFLKDPDALENFYRMGGRMPGRGSSNVGGGNNTAYRGFGFNNVFRLG